MSAAAAPALPEVKISSYGLHVGGGPNDRATKEPIERAVEARFSQLAACYRLAEEPNKGGIFGVDLAIPRGGGHATARQPRTGMKGKELRECLVHELEQVDFPAHKKGAMVISYSLKFEVGS